MAAFWAGLFRRYDTGPATVVAVPGGVGVRTRIGSQEQILTVEVGDGLIRQIFSVLNPVKLRLADRPR